MPVAMLLAVDVGRPYRRMLMVLAVVPLLEDLESTSVPVESYTLRLITLDEVPQPVIVPVMVYLEPAVRAEVAAVVAEAPVPEFAVIVVVPDGMMILPRLAELERMSRIR